jgi:hypothetical protein
MLVKKPARAGLAWFAIGATLQLIGDSFSTRETSRPD